MDVNKLYNMDCIKGMEQLYKEKGPIVDLILTDPPYNISQENRFKQMGRNGIDFGDCDKDFDLKSWLEPAINLLNPNGSIVIFNGWRNLSLIAEELEKLGCVVKSPIIWQKSNPMPRNRDRRYASSCEFAIWAVKSKKSKWVFNRLNPYENGIFYYSVVTGKKRIHPTQKNEDLIKNIISIHSNEKDLILDPFSGSGVISLAAYSLNRDFVSFEIEKDMYDKSLEVTLKDLKK